MILKEITKDRHITEHGHFATRLEHFVLDQTANRQGIAAADQNVGLQRAGINDRAAHICAGKVEGDIRNLVTDLRFHLQSDEVILVDAGGDDKGIAKLLILESTEDCGGSLFVEV